MLGVNSDACQLGVEEERILTSFIRRLIEIAAITSARGPVTPATSMLNSMHLPAIALDRCGFVVDVNTAAAVVFDDDVKVKDKRLFVRDLEARKLLKGFVTGRSQPASLYFNTLKHSSPKQIGSEVGYSCPMSAILAQCDNAGLRVSARPPDWMIH